MKCRLSIVVFSTISFVFSLTSSAKGHENDSQNIGDLHLQTGIGDAEQVLNGAQQEQRYRRQHKKKFARTLGEIGAQAMRFEQQASQQSKIDFVRNILPNEFHRIPVLALALGVEFSPSDDEETRAKKYTRLGLLLKDIYDVDNMVSRNLGLLDEDVPHLSKDEINYLVTEAFDQAVILLANVETTIARERAIDFHLSFAQVILWRLYFGRQSIFHMALDFKVFGQVWVSDFHSKRLKRMLREQLTKASLLIDDPSVDLPVVYHRDLHARAQALSADEQYDLIQMHKDELDKKREAQEENLFDALQEARGLSNVKINPLDNFTLERFDEMRRDAQSEGIHEEHISQYMYNRMKEYALQEVVAVDKYFSQDVIQRYLLLNGIVTRDMLKEVLLTKMREIENSMNMIQLK